MILGVAFRIMHQMPLLHGEAQCSRQDFSASPRRAQAVHALVKDERHLDRRAEYSGFSRGDMLSAQGSANAGSASLRRSVCHLLLVI